MRVRTGVLMYWRKRSAWAAASLSLVTIMGSPLPAKAMPSISQRLTLLPMPKEKKLASPLFWRMSSKHRLSTVT